MDERELVLTSLIYPLIFREAAQIGIVTPVTAHIRELLKIQTPEPEVIKLGNASPVSALIRNIFQNYEHPLQDFAQIGVAKPVGAHFKNAFNEYIHPHSDFTQIGNVIPVSMYSKNMLQNLQTFKTDHVVQVSNAIPEAVYSTCKPVVFAPTNLKGAYIGTSIQLLWSNNSITHTHQNLYRSTTPFTESNLPPVYQYIFRGVNRYTDEDVVEGVTYYYAVSTEAGLVQLVSDVTEVVTVESSNCDPHWGNVVALLHFDGDLTDETGRVWSQTGSPIIGGVGRFGGCITFSGNSSERVSSNHAAFGTDDWTVEMWVKFNSTTGQQNFFENLNSSGINPAGRFTIYQKANTLRLFINSADRIITPTPSTSVWHHISVSCESGIVRLFVNGEVKGSWNSGGLNFDQTLTLFGAGFGTASLFGAIDELRITKGVARYTENFTPPTEPFPNFDCS